MSLAEAGWALLGLGVAGSLLASTSFPGRPDPAPLLGRPAPQLRLQTWLGSDPMDLDTLRGRVVLVRWWTDTCPFCATTAPVLQSLADRYGASGLSVIGVFHPKPPGAVEPGRVRRAMDALGLSIPVGVDPDWSALRRWWLDHGLGGWTSVSFLVDRRGVIRWVHPGGEYHPGPAGPHWPDHATCRREYDQLVAEIERLLAEAPPESAPAR